MADVTRWLKAQLGPSPLIGVSMLVTTILGILSAFRITPSLPPWLGWALLLVVVTSATLYWIIAVGRLWPRVIGDPRTGGWRLRQRGRRPAMDASGAVTGSAALLELERMTGLATVKTEIKTLIQRVRVEAARREQGLPVAPLSLHMVFTGPPGVGKTVVARLYATILRDLGVLERGHLIEVDRSGLVAGYVGHTALKTKERIDAARDGVLFIDEAYALADGANHKHAFGKEAIDALLKEMEDQRDRLVVIVAGYPQEMRTFIGSNPGLASRFTKTIPFASYDADELVAIIHAAARRDGMRIDPAADATMRHYFSLAALALDFGNARTARTLLERAREAQAVRIAPELATGRADLATLSPADMSAAIVAMT